jgi:Putative phage holin
MTEPVSSAGAAVAAGLTSGVVLTALRSQVDPGMVAGILCGSFVFLTRSRESSRWRKALYFCVSLIGGYHLAQWGATRWPTISTWAIGFGTSASVVTVAVLVLDWLERNVSPMLDDLRERWLGKGEKHDEPRS